MKNITKLLAIVLTLALLFSFVGCKDENEIPKGSKVVASEMKQVGDRMVPYHNGKPYLFMPIHFRYDHIRQTLDENVADAVLEQGFEKIKESGWESVMLYISWDDIYDGKTKKYDMSVLEKQFKLAEKYDLKVHIVWFGSNVCGFSGFRSWQTDREKYPALRDISGAEFLGSGYAEGEMVPDFSNEIFAEEEGEAITKVCEWLYKNDKDRRTVAIQLEDEPDNPEGGYGQWVGQFKNYVGHLNRLAKAVKESPYSMIAYVNIMSVGKNDTIDGMSYKQRVKYIQDQEYIDFVGVSFYSDNTSPSEKDFEQKGNFPSFIGFGAAAYSVPGQTVYALSKGYAICSYQLINLTNNQDSGLFRCQTGTGFYVDRDGTKSFVGDGYLNGAMENKTWEVTNLYKSMFKIDEFLSYMPTDWIKPFNNALKNDVNVKKSIDGEKITFTFKDESQKYGGCGLMVKVDDKTFYGFASQSATYKFTSKIAAVTEGYFDGSKWISEGNVEVKDNTFKAEGAKTYQVVLG